MSIAELEAHPQMGDLMRRAITMVKAENKGEQLAREFGKNRAEVQK